MFPTFLIGLREGLEAALVVGILVAYLVKSGHRDRLRPVWAGVGLAVLLSFAVAGLLTFASEGLLQGRQGETFAGVVSLVAVAFVTWMIFWMRRTARFLKTELQDKLAAALTVSSAALATTAFLAVGREGLETSFFLWSTIQATGSSLTPVVGASLGLLTAVALGYLLYRRAISLNLARFFTWTGAGLVVVAAGVLSYAVHDLQEGGVLPGLNNLAFDVSGSVPLSSWYGSLLHGIIGFTPETSWLQLAAFVLYLVPVMALFFAPTRASSRSAAVSAAGKQAGVPPRPTGTSARPAGTRSAG